MLPPLAVKVTLAPLIILSSLEIHDASVAAILALGVLPLVNTTSSLDVHVPLVTVQRKVAVVPVKVTVEVGLLRAFIVAIPDTSVHVPVPREGVLPAIVKLELLQLVKSAPALAVRLELFVSTTSSEEVQPL